jgi:hypothetical protein
MFAKRKGKKKNNKLKDGLPPLPSARTKASFGLEEKLLHLWRTPITQLPVYKDLPRTRLHPSAVAPSEAAERRER